MGIIKPDPPIWCTTGIRVEPSATKRNLGWLSTDTPPDTFLNWIQGNNYDWIEWFNERFIDAGGDPDITGIVNPATNTSAITMATTSAEFPAINTTRVIVDSSFLSNLTCDTSEVDGVIKTTGGLSSGVTTPMPGQLYVGSSDFRFQFSGSDPSIVMIRGGDPTRMTYDRSENTLRIKADSDTNGTEIDFASPRGIHPITADASNCGENNKRFSELHTEKAILYNNKVTTLPYTVDKKRIIFAMGRVNAEFDNPPVVVNSVSYNIGSVTRQGTGEYTVNLAVSDVSSDSAMIMLNVDTPNYVAHADISGGFNGSSFQVKTFQRITPNGAVAADMDFYFILYTNGVG